MSAFRLELNRADDVQRAVHLLQQTGNDHRIPALDAMLAGRIGYFEAERTGCAGRCKKFLAATARKPALILIGDDDGLDTGPAGWPLAQRLLKWAAFVVLHATGAQRWHYETSVNTAELVGRVLLIECGTKTLPAWTEATKRWAPKAGVQIICTTPGDVHPIATAEDVH